MKANISAFALFLLMFPLCGLAADDAAGLFQSLERRLQSLKSLEIEYQATGTASTAEILEGRMVWLKPDRFYHDTPEWTFCEAEGEQWRLLKGQNTLIRESVTENSAFQPERMLMDMRAHFRPVALQNLDSGNRLLRMETNDAQMPGQVEMEFPAGDPIPVALTFSQADGGTVRYHITRWNENAQPDPAIFAAPSVPAENVIDFRAAGTGR